MSNVSISDWRVWARADTSPSDTVVQAALDASETLVAERTQRYFVVADAATAMTFSPYCAGETVLRIPDCTTVTAVSNDGTTVLAADYQLEPGAGFTTRTRPIEAIRLTSGSWAFEANRRTVSITATWGWLALPYEYVHAVKLLTDASIGEFNSTGVLAPPKVTAEIAEWLVSLRRVESWGIA